MSNNRLIKNTIIIMIGNIGSKLLMLLMVPLYTNWLIPEEYGSFDLVNSMACFFVPIVTLQLDQAVFRYVFEKKEKKEKIFTVAFFCTIAISLIIGIITFAFFHNNKDYYWVLLFVITQSIFNLIKEYIRGEKKMGIYSISSVINIVFILILNVITIYYMNLGVTGIYLSYIIAYSVCSVGLMIMELPFCFEHKEIVALSKKMLLFSIPLIPNTIAFWIVNLSDRFMIKLWLGEYYNGQYAIACKVPSLITTLYSAFTLAWQAEAIELIKKKDYKKITSVLHTVVNILFSGMFVISASMPLIYKYFINENYSYSLVLVPTLLLGTVWLSVAQFINGILIANYNTKDIGITTSLVAVINVAINFIFMKRYGLIIAAVSTAVAYFVLMILRMNLIKQMLDFKLVVRIVLFSMLEMMFLLFYRIDNMIIIIGCILICGFIFAFVNKELFLKFIVKRR